MAEIQPKDLLLNILQQVEIGTSNSGNNCIKDIDEVVTMIEDVYWSYVEEKETERLKTSKLLNRSRDVVILQQEQIDIMEECLDRIREEAKAGRIGAGIIRDGWIIEIIDKALTGDSRIEKLSTCSERCDYPICTKDGCVVKENK